MTKDTQAVPAAKPHTPKYLKPSELCDRWNGATTIGTLANWRSKGKGPPFIKFGSSVRYPIDLVEKWEAENTHDPVTMGGVPAEAGEQGD
ncbi:hypothetical protein ACFZAC_26150 [Pseudomonas fluorescens]|uniref:hypothetical protein n=1 Tax=Pseudomonas fluorescens TaxID=294 RepID=UPI00374A0C9D